LASIRTIAEKQRQPDNLAVTSCNKIMDPAKSNKWVRQQKYSDLAIETVITLRLLFHLPLRQAEDFVLSLFELMKVGLPLTTRPCPEEAGT